MRTLKDITCYNCQKVFTAQRQLGKDRYFCSRDCYHKDWIGKRHNETTKAKMSEIRKRWRWSDEIKAKMRISSYWKNNPDKVKRGPESTNWRGGVTPINLAIRNSKEMDDWRMAVFVRDDFTCQECGGEPHGKINAHHIKPFSRYPLDRFDINNGVTLCIECHKKTPTYGGMPKLQTV